MGVSRVKVGQVIWSHVSPESLPTILRGALGIIFITGGTNLTFAPDPVSLAQSYPNPAKGWIFPTFVDVIANGLGMDVGAFLGISARWRWGVRVWAAEGRDAVRVVVRLSLAFTRVTSTLFHGGVMNNLPAASSSLARRA